MSKQCLSIDIDSAKTVLKRSGTMRFTVQRCKFQALLGKNYCIKHNIFNIGATKMDALDRKWKQ